MGIDINAVDFWRGLAAEQDKVINDQVARIAELEADNTLLKQALAANEKRELYHLRGKVSQLEAQIAANLNKYNQELLSLLGEKGIESTVNPVPYLRVQLRGQLAHIAELEAQLAAVRASVDVSGLPLRSINKRDMAATIMVQSLTIEHLEAQLAAVSPVGDEINLALIDDAEITALRAQLAAVQPWAEVGKRAIRNGWWIDYGRLTADGVFCRICQIEMPDDEDGYPYHPDTTNCVIPALFAQLEADNA